MATKYGTAGNNTLRGTDSNDFLFGGAGNDTLYGLARRDYLSGGIGNDTLDGGLGNDILNGGSGVDKFDFGHLHDADIIEDFSPNDVIALGEGIEGYVVSVNEYGNVRIATIDEDFTADTVQGSIVLSGVSKAEWTSWGGELGWFSLKYYKPAANPNAPLIVFEDLAVA